MFEFVSPAKAEVQLETALRYWIPAYAGMTKSFYFIVPNQKPTSRGTRSSLPRNTDTVQWSAMTFDDTFGLPPDTQQDARLTSASIHMDFVDWRKGRGRYAVWAIDVDCESVRAVTARLRDALGDCLLPEYHRQPHLTVRVCGFPAPVRWLDDDYTPADFARHVEAMAQARIEPFRITIGMPWTFPGAAYLTVEDNADGIALVREALAGVEPGEPDFRFVPHVTIGLYRQPLPIAQVIRRMAACSGLGPIQWEVRRVALMTYDAAVITGSLHSICAFDLAENRLQVLDAEAMRPLLGGT